MFSSSDKFSESRSDNTAAICDIKKPKSTAAPVCDKRCVKPQRPTKGEDKPDGASIFRK